MSLDAERREQLISRLTQRAAQMGVTTAAILFLEMHKPLAFLGAQMLWVAQPFLNIWWNDAELRDLAMLLEDRAGAEALIERLEASSEPS